MKLYKQRLASPYYSKANAMRHSTTFNLRNRPGVYMIYCNSILCYVGYSSNDVYKTLYRHFEKWTDTSQVRVTYNPDKCKVRVIYTNTGLQADMLEKALIIKHKPKDNPNKYEQYTTDDQEEKIYSKYKLADAKPIALYDKDIPF